MSAFRKPDRKASKRGLKKSPKKRNAEAALVMKRAIRASVSRGVPLYRKGDTSGCAQAYHAVVTRYASAIPAFAEALELCKSSPDGNTVDSKVWVLRRAMDTVYQKLKTKATSPKNRKTETKVDATPKLATAALNSDGAETKVDSKPKLGVKVENKVDAKPKLGPKVETKVDTKPKLRAKAETKVDTKPKLRAKAETKVDTKPKLRAKAETKVDAKPTLRAKAETTVDTKPKLRAKAETKVDAKPKLREQAETKVDTKPKLRAKAETKVDTKPKLRAKAETKVDTKPKLRVQVESKVDIKPKLRVKTGTKVDAKSKRKKRVKSSKIATKTSTRNPMVLPRARSKSECKESEPLTYSEQMAKALKLKIRRLQTGLSKVRSFQQQTRDEWAQLQEEFRAQLDLAIARMTASPDVERLRKAKQMLDENLITKAEFEEVKNATLNQQYRQCY